jgi:hypothetical protein
LPLKVFIELFINNFDNPVVQEDVHSMAQPQSQFWSAHGTILLCTSTCKPPS